MLNKLEPLKTRIYDHINKIFKYVPSEASNIIRLANDDMSSISNYEKLILSRYILDIHLDNELNRKE